MYAYSPPAPMCSIFYQLFLSSFLHSTSLFLGEKHRFLRIIGHLKILIKPNLDSQYPGIIISPFPQFPRTNDFLSHDIYN